MTDMPPTTKNDVSAVSLDRRVFIGALFLLLPLTYFIGQVVAQVASRAHTAHGNRQ